MRTLTNNKPWETWFFQRGKNELFTGGLVSCYWVPKRDDAGCSENCMPRGSTLKNRHFLRGRVELFTRGWVRCCWVPKRDEAGCSENCMPRCRTLKNRHLLERKGWALYQRVSELLLSPREGWCRMKWKLHAKEQCPEKWASSWEEGLSSLPEREWAVAESQRGMTQDKVKLVCRWATPWKAGTFLRGRVELFTRGWVSWCWVPKMDDKENEKRMTTRQMKEIEKESINIFFNGT